MFSLLDRVRSWLPSRSSTRSVAGGDSWIVNPTLSGVPVNSDTALTFAAVYAAITVLASDVACFPFRVIKRDENHERSIDYASPVHEIVSSYPNEELSVIGLFGAIMWHLLTKGNAYLEIERDIMLRPVAIHLLDPDLVQVKRSSDRKLYYLVEGEVFLPADIIHIAAPGRDGLIGKSPIQQCKEEIGLGLATVKFGASYFGNGINPGGIVKLANTLDEEGVKALRAGINREHQGPFSANKFLILADGADFVPGMITSEQAQFLQTRKFNVEEVCRIFRIPPTKLMNFDKASFSNIEETNLDYYISSLLPWLRRIETEFSRKLFTRDQRRIWQIEHDETYTLRGRIADQANVDKIYIDAGVLSRNEVRVRRGEGKVAGGDVRFVPLNMISLDQAAALAKVPEPKPTDPADPAKPADPSTPASSPTGADAPVADVQGTALNGAQIASMLEIVGQVAAKSLPIGTAKGLIAVSFPTLSQPQIDKIFESLQGFTPAVDGDPTDPPPAATDAVRAVVADVVARMVKREANAIRSCSRKPDIAGLIDALEKHYAGEVETLVSAYSPALRAYGLVVGKQLDPRAIAARIVAESQAEIRKAVEGPGTSTALVALASRWEESKAKQILESIGKAA